MTNEPKKSQITKKTLGSIQETQGDDNAVFGFYNLSPLETALRQSSFDIQEEIEILVRHVRDPDPKVSLSALKQFRSVLKDVVTMNGMVGQARQTTDDSGSVTQTLSTGGLLNSLRRENDQPQSEAPYHVLNPKTPSLSEGEGPIETKDGP